MNTQIIKQNRLTTILLGLLIVLASLMIWNQSGTEKLQGASNKSGIPFDVVGTLTGTTTVGVSFYQRSASTTYPFRLANHESEVVLSIQTLATSTGSGVQTGFATFSILSSNDRECDTASTTYSSVQNNVVTSDIRWKDASNHLKFAAPVTSLSTGTTTIAYSHNSTVLGKELILTNLNSSCLALEVAASSTVLEVSAVAR